METGKKWVAGDMARQTTSGEVTSLKRKAPDLKEVVAEQTLELRLLKKSLFGDGGDPE
jgi:transposase